jgi:hypothetical protein
MSLISNNIKWIMLVAGVLTCTMFLAVIDPQTTLMRAFGTSLDGPLAQIVVRSWAAMITIVGLTLIYAAFNAVHQTLVLLAASAGKLVFVGLLLVYGADYLGVAMPVVIIDSVMVLLFGIHLLTGREDVAGETST